MPDIGNAKDCLKLPSTTFSVFTLKNETWRSYLWLVSQYSIVLYSFCLYRACFTHLISSNLSCNLCLWYYDQLVHFDKETNAKVYRQSLREYSWHFHCSFEWDLTSHMTLYIEACIGRTPCIKPYQTFRVNYNQAYLESLVKPGSTRHSILVDNCQKPGKSGSARVYQGHKAFNQTFGARTDTTAFPEGVHLIQVSLYMIQSPQLVRHCAWAIRHENKVDYYYYFTLEMLCQFFF